MKRRATSRRQVLNIDSSPGLPKKSQWQTKNRKICSDQMNSEASSKSLEQNSITDSEDVKLPQLVGYGSDSETDDSQPEKDMDSKVKDFLKEISNASPSETLMQDNHSPKHMKLDSKQTNSKSSKMKVDSPISGLTAQNHSQEKQFPTIAWQECYDENSGCCYYWNTETNEVTWVIPQELQTYKIAFEQWSAQQILIAQKGGGMISMFSSQSQVGSSSLMQEKKQSTKLQEKNKQKKSKSQSDSEDEKIELITSYGPNSDDEDSDNSPEPAPHKKSKYEVLKKTKKRKNEENIPIGPQLPSDYVLTDEMKEKSNQFKNGDSFGSETSKSLLSNKDTNTEFQKNEPLLNEASSKTTELSRTVKLEMSRAMDLSADVEQDNEKKSALQRLKTLKNKDSEDSDSESEQSEASSLDDDEKKGENNENDEEDVENSILEKLKNKAKILQELGGEIPEEIKELLVNSSNEEKEKSPPCKIEESEVSSQDATDITENEDKNLDNVVCEEQVEDCEQTEIESRNVLMEESNKSETVAVMLEEPIKLDDVEMKDDIEGSCKSSSADAQKSKLEEVLLQEITPTSFSLIAGYGNEDDSEVEEDKTQEKTTVIVKPTPLFPIVESEKEKPIIKSKQLTEIKLSAKARELIHCSTATGKARATDFVATSDGLRPIEAVNEESESSTSMNVKNDFIEPLKTKLRKKRLEVPVITKKGKTLKGQPTSKTTSDIVEKADPQECLENKETPQTHSSMAYSNTWAYNSELQGGEHRGFGYGLENISDQITNSTRKKMIQFVKADVLMPKEAPFFDSKEKNITEDQIKEDDSATTMQKEQAKDLSQLISEKVKYLGEGKEAVPPVQVMAIQIETLMAALDAGGLSVKYFLEWLTTLDSQLACLEKAAAPLGWQCQWDRLYKRYYYRNEASGAIQWEFPSDLEPPVQGGEEAMELCDSPPPIQPQPPPPPVTPSPPPIPPPPVPPPPPRISSPSSLPVVEAAVPPLPPLPPPPPIISETPPLPPLPPANSPSPPPLPPSPPPPPPPPIISVSLHSGEPLPPGVDLPEEMFEGSQPPLPIAPPPPPKSPPPPPPPPEISETVEPVYNLSYDVPAVHYDPYHHMQTATNYSSSMYPAYGSADDMYVIARPPASHTSSNSNPSTNLANELDSFYSEVAALEPPLPPTDPTPLPPSPPSPPPKSPTPPPPSQTQPVEISKKRKKTKLTAGIALKKKGVPSLVAKWQQVQEDVRREESEDHSEV